MMLFKSVIKGILLFSMILSLECWAESRQIKEKIGYVYDIIAEFGEGIHWPRRFRGVRRVLLALLYK